MRTVTLSPKRALLMQRAGSATQHRELPLKVLKPLRALTLLEEAGRHDVVWLPDDPDAREDMIDQLARTELEP